ncbi:inulin fructotransferase protein [Klebsiella michiganensis]|uniref:Inulin fructotransferase protein n=1 Tax=Klebsiella michiganensis TaxID=1134687 RepID=A0A7H4M2W2_9ENTR|nr:inulin fructotransferase protein [Klebsiella michiganensis]
MVRKNYYDVTQWHVGNPYEDIGEVINSILADIKSRQTETDINDGGKPGAAIYIPPGDYHLKTQVLIDISYLKIMGSGMVLSPRAFALIRRRTSGRICTIYGRAGAVSWSISARSPAMKNTLALHFT